MQRFTRRFLAACAFSGVVASAGAMADDHPTIRAMSGAKPVSELPAGKSALLVIDFQNEYFTGKMPIPDGAKALANTRELIKFADDHNMPVYHVQHIAPAGSAVFAIDGETVKFHPDMQPRANDTVVQKTTVSVFASTELDSRLKKAGIQNLIITGLMTHACVAGAARDAAPLGYNVLVASDASATRAITRVNGDKVDKDALHKGALAEIEDTFGDVMTTAQILKLPVR
ncbi:cysteine hydrolase family protein [Pseudomonas sp. 25 R 14]|uniref:cysteine hydrolase family protein n=1 Tax=Pseudomonas sp. 25 R 14 TaxID=1844109 RepID=UPI0008126EBE|nr:cysteine hydrolase family protein [Pseudomonas sp. 25 R 14]CRM57443.1 Streptothricin hydrolase [Pseudomonas sp. 25 R 14]